jgi:chromosomal replication initiation ATPase DnaA
MKHALLWQNVLSHISRSIDAHRFETWFRPLSVLDNETPLVLSLGAPNHYIAELLEKHYKKNLLVTAKMFFPSLEDIIFCVLTQSKPLENAALVVAGKTVAESLQ